MVDTKNLSRRWKVRRGKLVSERRFADFSEAVEFVNKVADLSERMNHHPDIEIYSYNMVKVSLTTHSVKKVTQKDVDMAQEIDSLL